MPKRTLRFAAFLAAALALPLFPLPLSLGAADAAAAQCEAQIDEALQKMSVPRDEVKSVNVKRRSYGAKAGNNYNLDAWIRLNSCSGYLVVDMTRHCMVQQSYTTGDCAVTGMPNY